MPIIKERSNIFKDCELFEKSGNSEKELTLSHSIFSVYKYLTIGMYFASTISALGKK